MRMDQHDTSMGQKKSWVPDRKLNSDSRTPDGRSVHWATRTPSEQGHLTEFICDRSPVYCKDKHCRSHHECGKWIEMVNFLLSVCHPVQTICHCDYLFIWQVTIVQFATHDWLHMSMYKQNNCNLPNWIIACCGNNDVNKLSKSVYFVGFFSEKVHRPGSGHYTAVSRKVVQQNRVRQCRKVLWEMGFMVFDWGFGCFSDIEGNITDKSIYAFSFLVGKHREPQSINAKLFLPIIPIGIVAYTLTLLWDNLCRNSCIAGLEN